VIKYREFNSEVEHRTERVLCRVCIVYIQVLGFVRAPGKSCFCSVQGLLRFPRDYFPPSAYEPTARVRWDRCLYGFGIDTSDSISTPSVSLRCRTGELSNKKKKSKMKKQL